MTTVRAKVLTISVPMLPPASQSPNSRCHWSVKASERKEFMQVVALAALSAGGKDVKLKRALVALEFVVAQDRRRDDDNWMIRASKPIGDTLVGLGVIQDDDSGRLTWAKPIFTVDKARAPLTIIRITPELR